MPVRFTDTTVRNFKAPKSGQIDHWDRTTPGFGMRIGKSGLRTWMVLIRPGQSTHAVRRRLGTYPGMTLEAAREKAKKWQALARDGHDPSAIEEAERAQAEEAARLAEAERAAAAANTFGALADRFLEKYAKARKLKPRTVESYTRALKGPAAKVRRRGRRRQLAGAAVVQWQDKPIASITRRDVHKLLDGMIDTGAPIAANRTLAYLRKFFSWCIDQGVMETSPADHVKTKVKEESRDRALSNSEIVEVWRAFEAEGGMFGRLFTLLLLLGARRTEVAAMTWDELKLESDSPVWELPAARSKNHRAFLCPLAPQVVAILEKAHRDAAIEAQAAASSKTTSNTKPKLTYVFSGSDGKSYAKGFGKAKKRVDKFIVEARENAGIAEAIRPWSLHDLRRTVSTRMNEDSGVPPHIVEAVVNHVSGFRAGIAGTYNRALYLKEKRDALQRWANHIDALLGRQPAQPAHGNVVQLAAVR